MSDSLCEDEKKKRRVQQQIAEVVCEGNKSHEVRQEANEKTENEQST